MPIITLTAADVGRSRCIVRVELAGWLRGARILRRHGQNAEANAIERHATALKAWAGTRTIGQRQFDTRPRPGRDDLSRSG